MKSKDISISCGSTITRTYISTKLPPILKKMMDNLPFYRHLEFSQPIYQARASLKTTNNRPSTGTKVNIKPSNVKPSIAPVIKDTSFATFLNLNQCMPSSSVTHNVQLTSVTLAFDLCHKNVDVFYDEGVLIIPH